MPTRPVRERGLRAALAVALLAAGSSLALPARAAAAYVTIPLGGYQDPRNFDISTNGRIVVFTAWSPGEKSISQVFAYDRVAKRVEVVSVALNGKPGDAGSDLAAVSADGRYVSFMSLAGNLVRNDKNGYSDAFVRDRVKRTTTRVSYGPGLSELRAEDAAHPRENSMSGSYFGTDISADGNVVVFVGDHKKLNGAGDAEHRSKIYWIDRRRGPAPARRVVGPAGKAVTPATGHVRLSADGSRVAFASMDALTPDDTDRCTDIYTALVRTPQVMWLSNPSTPYESASDTQESNGHCGSIGSHLFEGADAAASLVAFSGANEGHFVRRVAEGAAKESTPAAPVLSFGPLLPTGDGKRQFFLGFDRSRPDLGSALYRLEAGTTAVTRVTGKLDDCPARTAAFCVSSWVTGTQQSDATATWQPPKELATSHDGTLAAFTSVLALAPGATAGQYNAYVATLS